VRTEQQLNWVLKELHDRDGRDLPTEDALEQLVRYVTTFKNKAYDVEMARQKVTSDVEKLIKNQETFEKRVSEMD